MHGGKFYQLQTEKTTGVWIQDNKQNYNLTSINDHKFDVNLWKMWLKLCPFAFQDIRHKQHSDINRRSLLWNLFAKMMHNYLSTLTLSILTLIQKLVNSCAYVLKYWQEPIFWCKSCVIMLWKLAKMICNYTNAHVVNINALQYFLILSICSQGIDMLLKLDDKINEWQNNRTVVEQNDKLTA